MSSPALNPTFQEESERALLPQVFMMLADPVLERVYRSHINNTEYCFVWCEQSDRWKQSLLYFEYDVIIVDFSIFPSQPIDHLLAVRKLAPEAELIVLTDNEDVRVAVAAFQMGIAEYFLKPTPPESIAWSIEKILRRRRMRSSHASLNADLMVFSAAQHIGLADNAAKMRELTLKYLTSLLQADGAGWFVPETASKATGFQWNELHAMDGPALGQHFDTFAKTHGQLLQSASVGQLASHSELWFPSPFACIPLKMPAMGGAFVVGVKAELDSALHARVEFLIRNLEISLENLHRLAEVRKLTYIDDLTGLYNARYLEIAVTAAIDTYQRTERGFSILFIDLDHFKRVNDTHGHLVGSRLLVEVAHFLKQEMRKPDQLFRYGGDEFLAVLHGATSQLATQVAERLRADVEKKKFYIHNKELSITLSIGVATFPEHGHDKQVVIQMADDAMYCGKKSGRNRVFTATKPESNARAKS